MSGKPPIDARVAHKAGDVTEPLSAPSPSGVDAAAFDSPQLHDARISNAAGRRAPLPLGATLSAGRLSVLRRIGEGGMGVVYEAYDRERKTSVALKTLSHLDASGVYRLKNEFRALADVRHPNLVRLHELFAEGDNWFFTMDLVDGEPCDQWVRPERLGASGDGTRREIDESRLRSTLSQLVLAVSAIHAAGKLHRDLKPSNVLVTAEGRVVVLDFGLAVTEELGGVGRTITDEGLSGTPAYMAPEQAAGKAATQASDFYAIGLMLFEALTGTLPFAGTVGEILAAKQRDRAPSARSFHEGVPDDLDALCAALLEREPSLRPDGAHLRDLLGSATPLYGDGDGDGVDGAGDADAPALLGRDAELAALNEAYQSTVSGTAVVLFVSGESGMGKSALVEAFLADLRSKGHAVVLSGRCYERENVPYKGFDALIDGLSRYLRKLSREEAAALLPRQVYALARLFPVLDRVPVVAEAPKREIPDPQALQSRGFAALRELLWAIRDRRPLVLYVDDLQWVDRDTTVLLEYLLGQPDAMPVLSIASYRIEGAEHNVLLQALRNGARANRTRELRELRVGPLSAEATRALAARHLGAGTESGSVASSVSREAGGSPFLVGELARFVQRRGTARLANVTLGEALADHVAQLPASARSLLELLALAGQPLPANVAIEASSAQDGHAALDLLRAEQLVRGSAGEEGVRRVECYHDRVREGVSATLSVSRKAELHAALARTLEPSDDADPELLATCYEGAGDPARAGTAAERGGDRAVNALAFERAARLYEKALALGRFDDHARRGLLIKCGDALVGAGRGPDAARAFREAAVGADEAVALELKRKAAYQLMTAGHVDEGRDLLGEVLASVGLRLPSSAREGKIRAVFSQGRLRIRGLALRPRRGIGETDDTSRALDVLWTVLQGLAGNDPFLLVDMVARYLRLSLDAGSELHAARGLGYQAFLVSAGGLGAEARATALAVRAVGLAERQERPEALGFALMVHGAVLGQMGRFGAGRRQLAAALELLRTRCRGVAFELAIAHVYDQIAAYHLGRLREVVASTSGLVDDAVRRGDIWQATMLATAYAVPSWLVDDDPADVRGRLETMKRRWGAQSAYRRPDAALLIGEQRLLRYQDDATSAFSLVSEQWPPLERAQLLRAHVGRAVLHHERGSSAVGALRQGRTDVVRARAVALSAARALRRTGVAHAPAWAALVDAGLAQCDGQEERTATLLRSAITVLDENGLAIYAAAARCRLGQLLGGQEGSDLVAQGDATMLGQGVKNLDSMTEMLCPGCRRR